MTRLIDTQAGYTAISDNEATIDKLLTPTAQRRLNDINLTAVIPPDVRARRTIFARQVDTSVGSRTPDELRDEIQRQNQVDVTDIIKIKDYTHVFKIVTASTTDAQRLLTNGIKVFNTRISPAQCEQEKFTHILTCYKCYRYETHATTNCPDNLTYCSECAEIGHNYRDCTSTTKNCINCKRDGLTDYSHRTLAAKCPIRKQTIINKDAQTTQQKTAQQNQTYATIAKQAVTETLQTTTTQPPTINITNKTHLKLTALILEAHIASLTDGQNYGQILSRSLKDNFDIDAKFPDRNSTAIFNLFFNNPNPTDQDYQQMNNQQTRPTPRPQPTQPTRPAPFQKSTVTNRTPPPPPPTSPTELPQPLPKSTETVQKRKASEEADKSNELPDIDRQTQQPTIRQTNPRDIGFRIFKSSEDRTPYPDIIDNITALDLINRDDTNFGLKFIADRMTIDSIFDLINSGQLVITRQMIETLTHIDWTKMDRARIRKSNKKQKAQSKQQ